MNYECFSFGCGLWNEHWIVWSSLLCHSLQRFVRCSSLLMLYLLMYFCCCHPEPVEGLLSIGTTVHHVFSAHQGFDKLSLTDFLFFIVTAAVSLSLSKGCPD